MKTMKTVAIAGALALSTAAQDSCSRPGRDSQPFGVGYLIGAVISAALWAAIGAVMFFPSGATKIASLLVALR